MPDFKTLKTIERVNPKTKQFEQIPVGTVLHELTDDEFRTFKRLKAIAPVEQIATQAPDVSAVLDAAAAAPVAAKQPKAGPKESEVT